MWMTIEPIVHDFAAQAQEVIALCQTLSEEQWGLLTECPGWTVRDVLSHLYGTEAQMSGAKTPELEVSGRAYVKNKMGESNQRWVESLRSFSPQEVLSQFEKVIATRIAQLEAMGADEFGAESQTPKGTAPYSTFIEVRIFDMWMHEQDIRETIGIAGGLASKGAIRSFAEFVSTSGYLVKKKADAPEGSVVRFLVDDAPVEDAIVEVSVLEGRASAVLGMKVGSPDVVLEVPFRYLMRYIGGRMDPQDALTKGTVTLEGDIELGKSVLKSLPYVI